MGVIPHRVYEILFTQKIKLYLQKRVKTTKFSHMYVSPMLENGLSLTLLCYKMVWT